MFGMAKIGSLFLFIDCLDSKRNVPQKEVEKLLNNSANLKCLHLLEKKKDKVLLNYENSQLFKENGPRKFTGQYPLKEPSYFICLAKKVA